MTGSPSTRKALLQRAEERACADDHTDSHTREDGQGSQPALQLSMKGVPAVTKERKSRLAAAARDPKAKRKALTRISID